MNFGHLHLLINHLPIVGSILGAFVLIYALYTKSYETKNAAYIVFIICAIASAIAYFTGESAEESVENIQGISKNIIEQHESSAVISFVTLIILGISSLIAFLYSIKKRPTKNTIPLVILIIALVCFGLIARTGYLGGQIRHTEFNTSGIATSVNTDDDDKD